MAQTKMILLNTGLEDKYLTGDPDYTFFKQGIKEYTYFGQNWNLSSPNFAEVKSFFNPNCKYSYRLPVQGDVISDMVLRIGIDQFVGCDCISGSGGEVCPYNIVKKIEIRYNDLVLSSLDINYINIFYELSSDIKVKKPNIWSKSGGYFHLPLPFWFARNPGSAFPIWLLDNPQITIHIETGDYTTSGDVQIDILSLYTNLTTNEKDTFKHSSLEYLIEQVDICNTINIENSSLYVSVDLPDTKFIKYLVWNVVDDCESIACPGSGNDLDSNDIYIQNSNILLNGNSISGDMSAHRTLFINRHCYFKTPCYLNPLPNGDTPTFTEIKPTPLTNIHTYSFSLNPNSFQSTGFLSSDKFNTFKLKIQLDASQDRKGLLHTYAIKNNIMRIKEGQMELLYN